MLARIQAAGEGDTWPFVPQRIKRLGAPFGADWNSYPTPDKLLFLALGGLARITDLAVAANIGLLLAQISAALAFYWVARNWQRSAWEWAAACALLFAYTYATFSRGLAHLSFVFIWTVPLGLLASWLVARSRRLEWGNRGGITCLAVAVVIGAHNPYYLYFWLQLMGWAVVAQWFGPRRRRNLEIGLAAIGVSLVMFFALHCEYWLYVAEPRGLPLLARNYGGTERYALKPVEMLIPPSLHRSELMASLGHRYNRWSDWLGEGYVSYLGVVGIAGLTWLLVDAVRRVLTRRALPVAVLATGWLVAFATMGGVTNVISFFSGMQMFRATNRVIVFLSAIVLLFLASRLSRLAVRWPRWVSLSLAAVVAVLGLLDEVPRAPGPESERLLARMVSSDRQLGSKLEASLPPGSMVFQLPVVGFPEVVPPWRLGDYEHFRPYLHTRTIRFTYGAAKGRSRSQWQDEVRTLSTEELVRRLESYGFAAVYVNRNGYEDRADRTVQRLISLGYRDLIEGAGGQQVVVRLHPAEHPIPPAARRPTFGSGWHPALDGGTRWAYADAEMAYLNPYPEKQKISMKLSMSGLEPGRVELWQNGRLQLMADVGPEPRDFFADSIELAPGVNIFEFRSNRSARRTGEGRYQLRLFALHAIDLEPEAGSPLAKSMPPEGRNWPRWGLWNLRHLRSSPLQQPAE